MSLGLDRYDVVAAMLIIASLQISVRFTSARFSRRGNHNYCIEHKRFNNANKTIINASNKELESVTMLCSGPTSFEIRYTNGSLCACGQARVRKVFCKIKLLSSFTVYISVRKRLNHRRNCLFVFKFEGDARLKKEELTIFPKAAYNEPSSLTGMPAHSSAKHLDVSKSITKTTFTPLSTSLIGHLRSGSSNISNQFVTQNFVTNSNQISPTMAKQIFSQTVVPSNTAILMKDSVIENTSSSSFIQATPSTSSVFSSDILPSDEEKKKKLKEGNRNDCVEHERFNNAKKTISNPWNKELESFTVQCSRPTSFEVRYTNGSLCGCGQARVRKVFCKIGLLSSFTVYISVRKRLNHKRNCLFIFKFNGDAHITKKGLTIFPKTTYNESSSLTGMPAHSSATHLDVLKSITKTTFTTFSTSLIGHLRSGSSSISNQFVTQNFATNLSQISPTMAKEIFSQTLVLSNTEIFTSANLMKDIVIQNTSSSSFIQATPSTSSVFSTIILPSDEEKRKKLKEDIKIVNNFNASNVDINDKKKIERVLDAAANLINTNLTTEDQNEDPGMKAVEVLEDLGNSISQQLALPKNESSVIFEEVTDELVFGVAVVNATTTPGISFPSDESKATGDEKINIPSSVFASESGKAYFVGIIFKPYREMRNKTGELTIGTKVINAAVSPPPRKTLSDPVEMTFKKNNKIGETIASDCSFWIENVTHLGEHGGWSTKQCERTFENHSHIKCQCYHFTNFAVLFKVSDNQDVSDEDTFRLVIITYIGLSLSILGCLLTFVIYVTLSNIKTDRAVIHTNLVLALGIADVIFLVTMAVKPTGNSCLTLAMFAFFFYLAVFFWMLDEGVYIYLMVIKVFRGNDTMRRRMAYLVGWGCPAIIAIITWVALRDDVVSQYHCWLSVESGAIWAFVGPGLLIILVNFIILMVVMRTTWATFVDDREYGGLKSATKTFGAVIPILGITWVFGVMAFNESSIVFQYIFAITNSIQGALIFILYCLVNNEVRSELRRKLTIWQTRREFSSSSAGAHRTLVSLDKNTTFNLTTTSAQATPDRYRYPMGEIKDEIPQEKVERRYSFEDINGEPQKELELGTKEERIGEKEGKASKETAASAFQ